MITPHAVDVPMVRAPFANWVLIAGTSIISLAVLNGFWPAAPEREQELTFTVRPDGTQLLHFPALIKPEERTLPLALRPFRLAQWQYLTYVLVHANIYHLAANMIFLFVFGNAVNAKLGHGLYLASYFSLGILAGVVWLFTGDFVPMIGASGAIMGIVGIFLVLFPRNDVSVYVEGYELCCSSMWLILFYFICDFCGALFFSNNAVAYVAHLGGLFAGTVAGLCLVGRRWIVSERYEENLLQTLGLQKKPGRA